MACIPLCCNISIPGHGTCAFLMADLPCSRPNVGNLKSMGKTWETINCTILEMRCSFFSVVLGVVVCLFFPLHGVPFWLAASPRLTAKPTFLSDIWNQPDSSPTIHWLVISSYCWSIVAQVCFTFKYRIWIIVYDVLVNLPFSNLIQLWKMVPLQMIDLFLKVVVP